MESELNDRMGALRAERDRFRRVQDEKTDPRPTETSAESQARLDASYAQDSQRWTERYVTRSATNLRRRALAAGNGHAA